MPLVPLTSRFIVRSCSPSCQGERGLRTPSPHPSLERTLPCDHIVGIITHAPEPPSRIDRRPLRAPRAARRAVRRRRRLRRTDRRRDRASHWSSSVAGSPLHHPRAPRGQGIPRLDARRADSDPRRERQTVLSRQRIWKTCSPPGQERPRDRLARTEPHPRRRTLMLAERLLAFVFDDEDFANSILGDLAEERAARLARGARFDSLWYWREVVWIALRASLGSSVGGRFRGYFIDVGRGLRTASRQRGLLASAALAIALGIAPPTTIFSIVRG